MEQISFWVSVFVFGAAGASEEGPARVLDVPGGGVVIHASLMTMRGREAEQKPTKPLTTQFIKRQPRLTKPLELKKRPQPK